MISEENLRLQWALAYPFARPDGPFLFVDGKTLLLTDTTPPRFGDWRARYKNQNAPVSDLIGERRASVFEAGEYRPVVAVGSNAAPVQLRRKYGQVLDDVVVPVIKVTVADHIIAWAKHIAPYGSVAATIAHHPGARVEAYATLLSLRDYETMNRTEELGTTYDVKTVEVSDAPAAITQGFEAYTCLAGHMPLAVAGYPAEGLPYPAGGQWEAQAMAIRALGLHTPVDVFIAETVADTAVARQRDQRLARMSVFD